MTITIRKSVVTKRGTKLFKGQTYKAFITDKGIKIIALSLRIPWEFACDLIYGIDEPPTQEEIAEIIENGLTLN